MENLGKLLYRHFILNQKKFTLYLLATGLTFLALFFFQTWVKHVVDFRSMLHWYMPVFYVIGFVHSAHAFGDLSTPARSYQFLLLPASNLEKFISVWLVASVFYVVASYIVFLLAAGFGGGIAALMFGYEINYFSFSQYNHLPVIGNFLILQTVFLLGSLTFRNGALLKTVLSIVIVGIIFFIISIVIVRIVFGTAVLNFSGFEDIAYLKMRDLFENYVPMAAKVLYWGVMAPFFLVASYFKMKEREV